jgi:gluconokinase
VLLDAGREDLLRRLNQRPDHYMPASLLESQLATLERPHADEGVLTLDAAATPAQLCERAEAWLAMRAGGVLPPLGHQPLSPS